MTNQEWQQARDMFARGGGGGGLTQEQEDMLKFVANGYQQIQNNDEAFQR